MINLLDHTPTSWSIEDIFYSVSSLQSKGRKDAINIEMSRVSDLFESWITSLSLKAQLLWPNQNKDSTNTVTTEHQRQITACQVSIVWQMSAWYWALSFCLSSFLYTLGVGTFLSFPEEETTLKDENASSIFQDSLYFLITSALLDGLSFLVPPSISAYSHTCTLFYR